MMPFMGGMAWLWMLAALLIVVGIVVVIDSAFRGSASDADAATRILRARFARGEITADELRTAMATLGPEPSRRQAPRRLLIVAVALLIAGI